MLTPDQLTQLKSNTTNGGVTPTQTMTPEQARAWIGGSTTPTEPNYFQRVGQDWQNQFNETGQKVADTSANNPSFGNEMSAGLNVAKNATGAALAPIQELPGMKQLGDFFNAVGKPISDTLMQNPTYANAATKLADFFDKNPGVSDALSTANNVLQLEGAKGTLEGLANTAMDTTNAMRGVNVVTDTLPKEAPPPPPAPSDSPYYKSALEDWKKPTTVPMASYSKATEILKNAEAKGTDIPKTLVDNKINLADNVEEGKYATADTAEKLRTDAGKLSSEALKPSLQMADYSTPKTPVEDIIKATIEDIKDSKGSTPGSIQSQIQKAMREGEALKTKYPDGMGLSDMHDNKIAYAMNGKYSPIGDVATNDTAATNRAYGRVLADMVETKAPKDLPVHEFNAELAKQFQAADYLDALNNKKVPRSLAQRVMQTTAKVVGAATGHALGGGILGGVGGYHIGGMLESMLENMSNPMKTQFLSNLEQTNPEAFKSVTDYLGAERTAQLTRKALPAPSTIVTPYSKGTPGPNYNLPNEPVGQSNSLDQSGSVAQPMSNISKNSMPETISQPVPKVDISYTTNLNDLSKQIVKAFPSIPGAYADQLAESAITLVKEGGRTEQQAIDAIKKLAAKTPKQQ